MTISRLPPDSNADDIAHRLREAFRNIGLAILWVVVALEDHHDGMVHAHCECRFLGRTYFNYNTVLGAFRQFWTRNPIYFAASNSGWLLYMLKEYMDPTTGHHRFPDEYGPTNRLGLAGFIAEDTPITWDHIRNIISPTVTDKQGKHTRMAQLALEKGLKHVMLTDPGYYAIYRERLMKFLKDHKEAQAAEQRELQMLPYPFPDPRSQKTPHDAALNIFFNYNFSYYMHPAFKHARHIHLWIHGPPGCGKSRLISTLQLFTSIYRYHFGVSNWQKDISDDPARYIVMDEFEGETSISLQKLNELCDGIGGFEARYIGEINLNRRMTLIIISNSPPSLLYKASRLYHQAVFDAMCERFVFIEIPRGEEIRFLSEYWQSSLPTLNIPRDIRGMSVAQLVQMNRDVLETGTASTVYTEASANSEEHKVDDFASLDFDAFDW